MLNNRRKTKYDKDPVFDAVVKRLREKGKGFFIISCGAWIHPLNTVLNCYAIMFDGFAQYKFELTEEKSRFVYKVAEIRSTEWLTLRLIVGQTLTQEELIEKISEG